ncbi:hypothetical protein B0H13DRAFT_1851063 [Mycena leptocephala]|nr:hypothetical protein B0H13DRAFT_1851063 [Mycena leptocephala]
MARFKSSAVLFHRVATPLTIKCGVIFARAHVGYDGKRQSKSTKQQSVMGHVALDFQKTATTENRTADLRRTGQKFGEIDLPIEPKDQYRKPKTRSVTQIRGSNPSRPYQSRNEECQSSPSETSVVRKGEMAHGKTTEKVPLNLPLTAKAKSEGGGDGKLDWTKRVDKRVTGDEGEIETLEVLTKLMRISMGQHSI